MTARRAWLALAFVAIASLLLRPVCEFTFAAAHTNVTHAGVAAEQGAAALGGSQYEPGKACCLSVGDALFKPIDPLPSRAANYALGVVLAVPTGLVRTPIRPAAARTFHPPFPERSYYARSARILR